MADPLIEIQSILSEGEATAILAVLEVNDQATLMALHLAERQGRKRLPLLEAIEKRGIELGEQSFGTHQPDYGRMDDKIAAAIAKLAASRPTAQRLNAELVATDAYPVPHDYVDPTTGHVYDFLVAPDLKEIAEDLLNAYPDQLRPARNASVRYLWKKTGGSDKGKPKLGMATKLAGAARFESDHDFLIWLASDTCDMARVTLHQVRAAMFHELCHVGESENYTPAVLPHDVEMFVSEVEEFGLWKQDLVYMGEQLRLDLGGQP